MTRRHRLALALISLWLGMMLFLAFVVPPAVFGSVGRKEAGRIMARVFPPYYAGSVLLPAAALIALWPEAARSRPARVTGAILGASAGLAAVNALVISPWIERVRAAMEGPGGIADPGITATFGRLHLLSVGVIALLILLALAALAIQLTARPRSLSPPG